MRKSICVIGAVSLSCALLMGAPAFADIELSGEWRWLFTMEDREERLLGPELGDYAGVPVTPAAMVRADAWDAAVLSLPERQCNAHVVSYGVRGPTQLRITKFTDPETQKVNRLTIFGYFWGRGREVFLDGRPHPSSNDKHSWMGFSTGEWEGNALKVTTTHMKEGYLRRNGLPVSDRATLTEYFIRNGDVLTDVTILRDPVYLTEPLIRTTDYAYAPNLDRGPVQRCSPAIEVVLPDGMVPNILPGTEDRATEYATKHGIPRDAVVSGAESMYPEFRFKMLEMMRR